MTRDGLKKNVDRDPRLMRRIITGFAGLIVLSAGLILSVTTGAVHVSVMEIIGAIAGNTEGSNYHIIYNIRLPRIIVGAMVGINLAIAGAILQGVLRNPLADPGIIGVTAGAGLAAMTIMILFPESSAYVPLGAFIGAIAAAMIVYSVSWNRGISPMRLILAGIAVAAFFGAGTSTLMVFHSDKVQGVLNWLIGGFQGRSWGHVEMLFPYTLIGLAASLLFSRHLNILMLGDDAARGLGMRVEASRLGFITLASFLAASAVSVAGLIGFVGLITPHIVRLIVGSDHRYLIPFSAVAGAILIVYADTLARTIFSPVEIPVGVFMAFLGAPFFLYLLRVSFRK